MIWIPGREIGAADAPCLCRVGVGRTSCLFAAGDDSGVTWVLLGGVVGGGGAAAVGGTTP